MATTEQIRSSINNRAVEDLTMQDFEEFFAAMDGKIKRRNRLLRQAYKNAMAGDTTVMLFLLRKIYGREVEKIDVTSKGEQITGYRVVFVDKTEQTDDSGHSIDQGTQADTTQGE